jgi:hypothetical protein
MEAVLSVRSLGGDGFFRIDTLLKKEEDVRREPRPWISFGTCYMEREREAQRAAREIFDKFLLIGTTNRAIINAGPVAWAYGQAEAQLYDEFGSAQSLQEFHKLKRWIKEYCDGKDQTELPATEATEDWLKYLLRENWRAPLWLRVAVSCHFASDDPSTLADLTEQNALQRLDKEETEKLLNGICRHFWSSVHIVLQNKARLESISLATQLGVGTATGARQVEGALHRARTKRARPKKTKKPLVLPGAMISGEVTSATVGETVTVKGNTNRRKPGRIPRVAQAFVVCAGTLWRKAMSDSHSRVPDDRLEQIASALDAAGHLPPSALLEGKFAQELKAFNSRNSNSKTGPVKTWSRLISLGDKDLLRGMRRLLSRCARKFDKGHLSGN